MTYTNSITLDDDFDSAVDRTIEALGDEGFGVLADIDVQATFAEKLGEDFRKYRILGACNPPKAHEGLTKDPNLGALLPCNVVVYENDDGGVVVSAVDTETLIGVTEDPELIAVAEEIGERFDRVLDELRR